MPLVQINKNNFCVLQGTVPSLRSRCRTPTRPPATREGMSGTSYAGGCARTDNCPHTRSRMLVVSEVKYYSTYLLFLSRPILCDGGPCATASATSARNDVELGMHEPPSSTRVLRSGDAFHSATFAASSNVAPPTMKTMMTLGGPIASRIASGSKGG